MDTPLPNITSYTRDMFNYINVYNMKMLFFILKKSNHKKHILYMYLAEHSNPISAAGMNQYNL